MAEERLVVEQREDEFHQIMGYISRGDSFLLSGGAGSGKTFSLVQVIRRVIADNPVTKVACMTYTNAAVKEIEERVNHKNLNVTTIHDFLWDNIKHFQKVLKDTIVELANDDDINQIRIDGIDIIPRDYFENRDEGFRIQYKEFLRLSEGIISHDELLIIAEHMFMKYPKLCDLVMDKYPFIFIDEYQDTQIETIRIFLEHFKKGVKNCIIGFFGDAMQSIYDNGVGNINEYKGDEAGKVKEVKKVQNRRNPRSVIDLANRLRIDGIIQEPSPDETAPNMIGGQVKDGRILFIHSRNPNISNIEQFLTDSYGWNFSDSKETKELNLTHNLIADKAGFRSLMDIYDKDYILDFKKRIKDYIKDNGIDIDFSQNTFGEVIDFLQKGKTGKELVKVSPTATMAQFIGDNPELFQLALSYNYLEFSKIYVDKDQLLDDKKQDEDDENKKGSKRDNLIRHLFKIQSNISLYINKNYNEFLRKTDYPRLTSIKDKIILKQNIESLIDVGEKTIEEIIIDAHEKGLCLIDEKLEKFLVEKKYVYDRVKVVKFSEFQFLFNYLEGKTPFSTQHKTKGTEFNNVLVVLDNGNWNKYNFENLFINAGSASVLERTKKIFYVCCTRAKDNLAVFYHNASPAIIQQAEVWFGRENVIQI